MNKNQKLIIIFLALFIFSWLNIHSVFSQNFRSEISLNKDKYLEGEPVWITMKVKNIGVAKDSIAWLNEEYVTKSFDLIGQDGKKKKNYFGEDGYLRMSYTVFESGEEFNFEIELQQNYGDQYSGRNFSPQYCFKPGLYSVQNNFKGLLKSNVLTFIVEKPEGPELEALNTLHKIYQLPDRNNVQILDKEKAYKEFWKKYKVNTYTELSFYNYSVLAFYSEWESDTSKVEKSKSFIEKYPNSFYLPYFILLGKEASGRLYDGKTSEIEFLKEIMQNYPDTRAYKEAEKQIKKLEKQ